MQNISGLIFSSFVEDGILFDRNFYSKDGFLGNVFKAEGTLVVRVNRLLSLKI